MKRIAWLTDIHLNFLPADEVDRFLATVAAVAPEAVLISGDIAESHDLLQYLERMDDAWQVPIYFVLGNHDYYYGRIHPLRHHVTEFCRTRPNLQFLTTHEQPIELGPGIGLVGHDGWADARLGDYEKSLVSMVDYDVIEDLVGLSKLERWPRLQALGDEAAEHVRQVLPPALARYEHVVFLTHVPPVREACWHEGRQSDDHWAPHFSCKAVGDALVEIMSHRPAQRLTVLCGHTHGCGQTQPLPNVEIFTGGAEYCRPQIQRVFEFDQ